MRVGCHQCQASFDVPDAELRALEGNGFCPKCGAPIPLPRFVPADLTTGELSIDEFVAEKRTQTAAPRERWTAEELMNTIAWEPLKDALGPALGIAAPLADDERTPSGPLLVPVNPQSFLQHTVWLIEDDEPTADDDVDSWNPEQTWGAVLRRIRGGEVTQQTRVQLVGSDPWNAVIDIPAFRRFATLFGRTGRRTRSRGRGLFRRS